MNQPFRTHRLFIAALLSVSSAATVVAGDCSRSSYDGYSRSFRDGSSYSYSRSFSGGMYQPQGASRAAFNDSAAYQQSLDAAARDQAFQQAHMEVNRLFQQLDGTRSRAFGAETANSRFIPLDLMAIKSLVGLAASIVSQLHPNDPKRIETTQVLNAVSQALAQAGALANPPAAAVPQAPAAVVPPPDPLDSMLVILQQQKQAIELIAQQRKDRQEKEAEIVKAVQDLAQQVSAAFGPTNPAPLQPTAPAQPMAPAQPAAPAQPGATAQPAPPAQQGTAQPGAAAPPANPASPPPGQPASPM